MKCPGCGFEIPEGHMYCDNCGTEINFVPDFEPEVENEINATLSGVADELNKDEKAKEEKRRKRKAFLRAVAKRWKIIVSALAAVILLAVLITVFLNYHNKTSLYYLSLAESAKSSGDTLGAIEQLKEGNRQHPDNSDIIFRMSDYYLEMGDYDAAVDSLMLIADSDLFSADKVRTYRAKNAIFLNSHTAGNEATEAVAIKKALMEYGGVAASMYWDGNAVASEDPDEVYNTFFNEQTGAYRYINSSGKEKDPSKTNHLIEIAGWDDNYPVENFNEGHRLTDG